MLSRPSDTGHTPFGDIFYSESPDLIHWGRHRFVMEPEPAAGRAPRSAPARSPIETSEGWLLFYHGVITTCNGFVYSYRRGAAGPGTALESDLSHRNRTCSRRRRSTSWWAMCPTWPSPCAALVRRAHRPDRHLLRRADTVTGLAFATVDEVIAFIKENSL